MGLKQKIINSPLYDWFGKRSFSQAGEDVIVAAELGKGKGLYVDIGAYHPKLFSNTYFFYKRGWSGLVVEPNSEMVKLYKEIRGRDQVLGIGVGAKDGAGDYFMFDDAAANTFDEGTAKRNEKAGRRMIGKKPVAILRLSRILDEYFPQGQDIDLLSVDVEGMDEEVLSSNDWKKYRPRLVICEDLGFSWEKPMRSGVASSMKDRGYRMVGMTPYSLIFKDKGP